MPEHLITSLDQVTSAWLTAVLSKSDALTRGAVAAFEADTGNGNWSANARLTIRYEPGSQGRLPQHLFLKLVDADLDDEFFGPSEVDYYTRDYTDVEDAPLVRCYDAVFSAQALRYHILLDDLSETHFTAGNKMPTLEYGLALAEGFAAMHARWWGAAGLAEAGAPIHSAAHIQRFVDIAEPGVGHILNRFSDELEDHWPQTMRTLYARHPQAIIKRAQDDNGFTLIHADPGPYNILVPRHGERPIYIIDRQPFDWSLTTWLGVYDLAYAIVLSWDVEVRRQLEIPILRHYHAQLMTKGVTDYPWERLFDDYRLCVPMGVYIATEYCRGGINEPALPYWLPKLKRSLAAFDDLNCSDLW